jgi:signal transduction histidine kinase
VSKWIPFRSRSRATDDRSLRKLEELTRSVALIGDFPALRLAIVRRFRELVPCDAAVFYEFHPTRTAFVPTAADGATPEDFSELPIGVGTSLVKWLRVNEETLSLPDPRGAHDFLRPEERDSLDRHQVRLCVPLLSVNRLVAIVLLASKRPLRLDGDAREIVAAWGRQTGLACEAAGRHGQELDRVRSHQHAERLAVAGQLAAAVAHEVRNPLTVIRSTMQLVLEADWPWEQKRPLLSGVMEEVDRIERTVARLLNLSRPLDIERIDVDLAEIAEEALTFVQPYVDTAAVSLVAKLDRRPLMVKGDPRELRSVLLNLLINSVQATPTGGTITLRSDLVTDTFGDGTNRPLTIIEITDSGDGMRPEVLERVFDPFFTTKQRGTGLGLPTALEIVQRHGGELRLASEPGHGTVASVLIPARTTDSS